jgi:peptidoglycan hydrolase-like protein with peptidoglycan-binding domain
MKPPQPWRRWVPAGAAIVILVIVLVAAMTAGDDDSSTDASDLPTSAAAIDSSTSTTAPAVIVEPTPTVPHTQLGQTVGYGNAGDEVKMVQQRLTDLGFAPGPIDGQFGSGTQQSVWAFEKLVLQTPRADVTGKVTNEMWQTMQDNLKILPLRPTGAGTTHVEIYVPQQVLIVFTDDTPKLITHISTGLQLPDGRPDNFCENADFNTDARGNPLPETVTKYVCADTKTPGGVFKIDHMLAGHHIGPLGGMDNPVYFNYGIAMHGAADVPKEPASHGCVRMNKTISLTFPQLVQVRDTVYVWGQDGKQPEDYTDDESLPSFNREEIDPNATTTTSSTTTTTIAETTTTSPATTTIADKPTTSVATPTTVATQPASPSETTTTVGG